VQPPPTPGTGSLAGVLPHSRDWRQVERGMVQLARQVQVRVYPVWVKGKQTTWH
jgi:hypothetical protein